MTVTNTHTKHIYPGDGQRTTWPFTFPLFNAQDLRLWRVGTDGKAEMVSSGFYVDMEEKEVEYPLKEENQPAPVTGEYIVLQRMTPLTQEFDTKRQQTLDLQTWEDAHDLAVMREQELAEELSRTLKFPIQTQTADTDAAAYLATITNLKDQAQEVSQEALETSLQANQNAQAAAQTASQAKQQAQEAQDSLSVYVSQAQAAKEAAQEAQEQAEDFSSAAQNYAQTCQQEKNSVQGLAQTVATQTQQAVNAAQTAQTNAQTAQTNAQSAQSSSQSAQGSAQSAAQSAQAAASSASLADIQNKITNCLTKIPQDINLVLSEGTLTLKAGSKVYVPNGPGVFDSVTLANDVSSSVIGGASLSTKCVLLYSPSDNKLKAYNVNSMYSGTSLVGTSVTFYDTTSNVVQRYDGGSLTISGLSFPIALITGVSTQITSIDQVFNGFGFIGSVPFILPGVECLRTNGRNTDGTLKSAPTTISTVLIPELIGDILRTEIYINGATSSVALQKGGYVYNEQDNLFYFGTAARNVCFAFSVARDSTGRILSLTPQNTFHTVDYNDLAKVDGLAQQTDSLVQNGRIGFPNLSAKVSINSGYTAPSNGWVLIISSNSNANTEMKFDNAQVYFQGAAGSAASAACGFIPIKKGQVVTITGEVSVKQFMPSL
ncbi:hypothetical protein [Candidatus Avelusimicrobium aviculae]|uniref:hypothetical protein n=1 Tax=Candidatus Avelusimicrobium aviculae TaxID=3416206 RepID=UPI003D138903